MKKRILSLAAIAVFISGSVFAQSSASKAKVNYMPRALVKGAQAHKSKSHYTKPHNWDGTMQHLAWMEQKDPTLKARMAHDEAHLEQWIKNHPHYMQTMKTQGTVTLPVVVHVVYANSSENISDAQVKSQITATNLDYARQNADTTNTPAVWKSVASAIGIQFCLAQIDPQGNPTTGIIHKSTTVSSFSTNDAVKYSSQGGDDAWDVTKYLNIWVCNMSGGILGYGEFPTSQVSQTYGAVIQYNAFGTTGNVNSPYNLGRTLTHEFSHCFNLYHIWGDDNGACTGTDYCADTPNQANATYGSPTFPVTDNCSPNSPGIMFMDYMDYSDDAAMNMFTHDQALREQASISNYYTSLETSGVCNTQAPPVADFKASATTISPGTSISFTDLSSNSPTSWSWTFSGSGVSPASSTVQNPPSVTYNNVGTYTVSLTATNSYGNNTATKTNYITVTNAQVCDSITNYPTTAYSTIYSSSNGGFVSGENGYGDKAKADKFLSSSFQPGYQITGAWLWFGKAYTASNGTINVNVWDNTGTSGAPGNIIGTKSVSISTIASDVSAGNKTHVTFSTPITVTSDFYLGIDFSNLASTDSIALVTDTNTQSSSNVGWELQSSGTWYPYSDASSAGWGLTIGNAIWVNMCSSTTGMQQYDLSSGVKLYPNPTTGIINAKFSFDKASDVNITVYNMLGEVIKKTSASNMQSGQLKLDMSTQPNGIYLVKIANNKTTITKRIVVDHL